MKKNREKARDVRRGIYILPNIITTAALFCGFFSIVNSINGDFLQAAWMILFAGVFDGLDGRVARLTRTHSDFGVEYDSLSDVASFGLAPSILVYTWTLHSFGKFGWAAAFLFFACGALRLARYNVQLDYVERNYFQGLPIPLAAYVIASYVIFHHGWKGEVPVQSVLMLVLTVGLAFLMVSSLPYRSFKSFNLKRKESFLVLVGMAVALFVIASAPSVTIFAFTLTYIVSGPVEALVLRLRRKGHLSQGLPPSSEGESPSNPKEALRVIRGKL